MAKRGKTVRRPPAQRKPPAAGRRAAAPGRVAADIDLKKQTSDLERRLTEALQQQTATADVLKVISRSTFDLQQVLQTLVESAARLCEADLANIWRPRGTAYHLAASFGIPGKEKERIENKEYLESIDLEPGRGSIVGRALLEKRTVQIADVQTDPDYNLSGVISIGDYRTMLGVPLLREGDPIGVIFLTRCTVRPFTDNQIELVTTFADQAVIAIENARLFDEVQARTADLSESLQQQTATADVLKVISRSAFDLQIVLDKLVESAVTLSGAEIGTISQRNGDLYYTTASFGYSDELAVYARTHPLSPGMDSIVGRVALEGMAVQIPDVLADPHYRAYGYQRIGKFRAILGIPLMHDGKVEGVFALAKPEPGPLAQRQVELVQTFADQAVIAIQNARLFGEVQARTEDLRESLQQQTATADVLKVISRSAFDLRTVLDALVASACRLCEADIGTIRYQDGSGYRLAATYAFTPEWRDHFARYSDQPDRGSVFGRTIVEGGIVHIPDVLADPEFARPEAQKLMGLRAALGVPLVREGRVFGVLSLLRLTPRPFTQKQIDLVSTFADQAVIAIENVRLFDEVQARTEDLRESLQQQTATADVLKVISRSTFDLQTVLQTLVESAARLSDAEKVQITRQKDGVFFRAEAYGFSDEFMDYARTVPIIPDRGSAIGRALLEGVVVHIPDVKADPDYTFTEAQKLGNFRTVLSVPMLREGVPIGVIVLTRTEARPFTDKQIELVVTFADQAAIAIENVRLFDEVQAKTRDLTEALAYQTGSGNILRVIASSPTNVGPVLKAIVESACELCESYDAILRLSEGGTLCFSAHHGPLTADREDRPINRYWTAGRAVLDQIPIHVRDMLSVEGDDFPEAKHRARTLGQRTVLSVPLLREGESIGAMTLRRTEVNPFTDKQIALLQSFADQAVIAIQNARLFNETREALEQQTATADILKVIASSPDDVQPVFDAIAERSKRLVDALSTTVLSLADEVLHVMAFTHVSPAADAALEALFPAPLSAFSWGERFRSGETVRIIDTEVDFVTQPSMREMARLRGWRSALYVPLLRDGVPIGMISVTRTDPGPFPEHHVQLLQTFADQAVIAIQNVRLFNETKEALERQTATADILKVIASSPDDVQPVFQAIADRSNRLVDALSTTVFRLVDGMMHLRAFTPTNPEGDATLQAMFPAPLSTFSWGESIRRGEIYSVVDTEHEPEGLRDLARLRGWRSCLCVPLLRDGKPIGMIGPTRAEPGPFADHHVQLLQTFADQAVIAISNVGLFKEVQERTRELSASLDDLRTAQDRLVQTEKLASLGQLTAGIAHEIKNPLNFVNNFSALSAELIDELDETLAPATLDQQMRSDIDELTQMLKSNLEKVVQHGKRADSIVKNMLLHSRQGSGEHRFADINALVEESLNLAYHGARAEKSGFNITLLRDLDPDAGAIDLYPQEVTRALLNLISNGFYAATRRKSEAGDDTFEPTLGATTKNLGKTVEIRIRDNGTGIPREVKEKMFNPFFTTKPAGEGTGLGLSMSHDIIVKQHGGRIDVETEPGIFTEFIITLPRNAAAKL